jgi:ribosome-associated toxin RatA of RatAB toxin-antitoxin module
VINISQSAIVPYSQSQMYELVADVPGYPEFLPWCKRTTIVSQNDGEMIASISLSYRGIRKTFTTRNNHTPSEHIQISLVDGPFSELNGDWRFTPIGDEGCRVKFSIAFDFSNAVLRRVVGPVFKIISSNMVDAFCRRADALYGDQAKN